jgi:prephenate dehydrogenase
MGAAEHDGAVAWVSHLPQLLSSLLAATVNVNEGGGAMLGLAGGGYKDMTRLAQSSWDVWRDIIATNAGPVAEALAVFAEQLTAVRREVFRLKSDGDAEARFTRDLFEQASRPPAPRAFGRRK